jgi:alkylated DNA repair dioxygenase AlkB
MNLSLFPHSPLPTGITLTPDFLSSECATELLCVLTQNSPWTQPTLRLFGKHIKTPRLVAWYSEAGIFYTYSGIRNEPRAYTSALLELKKQVEETTQTSFNSVLLNLYRNGQDSMSWHADDEKELGRNPVIASVNLGATRTFSLRKKDDTQEKYDIKLSHGSLLVMSGDCQHVYEHQVKKEPKVTTPRINLTFRFIQM